MTNPALAFQLARQSAATLGGAPLTDDQLATLIQAASTVPDHGKLRPYRFVVITAAGKAAFGEALAQVVDEARGGITEELKQKFRNRANVAPTQIAIIFSPKGFEKIPRWEQLICASCTGYAILLAATAMGLGANWRSSSLMTGQAITEFFSLTPDEEFLGWINLGELVAGPTAPRSTDGIEALLTTV